MNHSGILNINKEKNLTSHDVVYKIKKKFGVKVGHAGTLDPMATGVLLCCIGSASKISKFLMCDKKKYRTIIKFGVRTDSLDITGKILERKEFIFNKIIFLDVIKKFIGEYYQIPPMFSAIKQNGKKLYELARAGITVERKSKLIKIFNIDFLEQIKDDEILIDVECSSGTYIRSLCEDIGKELKNFACMSYLCRLSSGKFNIKNSIELNIVNNNNLTSHLIKIEDALDFKKLFIKKDFEKFLFNGNVLKLDWIDSEANDYIFNIKKNFNRLKNNFLIFDSNKNLIAIYKKDDNFLKPIRILS